MTLILSLLGALISLISLIIDKSDDKRKKVILILAGSGFLVFSAQQFVSYFSSRASSEIIKSLDERTGRIEDKTDKIDTTLTSVQIALYRLGKSSIEKVSVQVNIPEESTEIKAFSKRSSEVWFSYYEWLKDAGSEGLTALRFQINNNDRYYYHSLMLLYLMADYANESFVSRQLNDYSLWSGFPRDSDLDQLAKSNPILDLVIFEAENGEVVGFVEAKTLYKYLYQIDLETRSEFMLSLNEESEDFNIYAKANVPGYSETIKSDKLEEIGKEMIANNQPQTLKSIDENLFLIRISDILELR